jgi:antitoxin ParD1/3/4
MLSAIARLATADIVASGPQCYTLAMNADPKKTLTVTLSPQQLSRLQDAVASGSYASDSEVVSEALRLWEQQQEGRQVEIARLKRAYDEGMDSGAGREISAETLLRELKSNAGKRG